MTGTSRKEGQCVCGAITFVASNAGDAVGACHCRTCRRWSGGPFVEIDCGADVSFQGISHISVFNSSDWAERGFCSQCGTHLFYRIKETSQHIMPVGLFDLDDEQNLTFERQVFVDEKPAYYSFANNTEELTGEQVFAMFGPTED